MDELIKKEKIELAKRAIKDGMELKDVAKYFKLPLSVVEDIVRGKSVEGFIANGAEYDKEQELDQ